MFNCLLFIFQISDPFGATPVTNPASGGACGEVAGGDSGATGLENLRAVDVDGDGEMEYAAADATMGTVAYLWADPGSAPIQFNVNEGTDAFGADFAAGDFGGERRLVVADPNREIGGGTGAAYLYQVDLGAGTISLPENENTLYDSGGADAFAQTVDALPFGGGTVLGVGAGNDIYTYFRLCSECSDLRTE